MALASCNVAAFEHLENAHILEYCDGFVEVGEVKAILSVCVNVEFGVFDRVDDNSVLVALLHLLGELAHLVPVLFAVSLHSLSAIHFFHVLVRSREPVGDP